jgi:opacity protein-like surface antigen
MKKNISVILLVLLSLMPTNAQAQDWCEEDFCCADETNFYAKLFTGANFLQNTSISGNKASYETGYIIAGSFGYRFCSDLRVEAVYAYRRNAISKIHFVTEGSSKNGYFQTSSLMANLLWDVPLCNWDCLLGDMHPFIGGGIGYDFQKMHSSNDRIVFDQKWNHFAWQLMAGLAYPVFCNTEITLEYRFHQGGCHFQNHSIGVGLEYHFDLCNSIPFLN